MKVQNAQDHHLTQALHFANLMKTEAIMQQLISDSNISIFRKSANDKQAEFIRIKSIAALKSKIQQQKPEYKKQIENRGRKKEGIKQTTIRKNRGKLEKPSRKASIEFDTTSRVSAASNNGGQNISIKMLLNDQIPKISSQAPFLNQSSKTKRPLEARSVEKKREIWETPSKSHPNLQSSPMTPSSPMEELSQSQQIHIVKHNTCFQPSMKKFEDVIQRMEALKKEQESKSSEKKPTSSKKVTMYREQNAEHKSKEKGNQDLNEVYLRSLGNKYMKKIIQNYDKSGNLIV